MKRLTFLLLLPVVLLACSDNRTKQPVRPDYEGGSLPPLSCVPNLDGKIEASEMKPALGVMARYLTSPQGVSRTVNVAGTVDGTGVRVWDLGSDYADDQIAKVTASAIGGKWYEQSFPSATFVAPFDAGGTLDAIYANNDTTIALLGLASAVADPPEGRTLLAYDTPIAVFRFPLAPGNAWTSSGSVTKGMVRGQPYNGKDTYEISVDAAGRLLTPDFTFTQVLRVRTKVTVEPAAGQVTVQRQASFLFECFGEVARATSKPGEPSDDFTQTSELRRLGL
ncbi:MAG TPA: hypothetical protein VF316_07515 [Polyangiaceae bacterium]